MASALLRPLGVQIRKGRFSSGDTIIGDGLRHLDSPCQDVLRHHAAGTGSVLKSCSTGDMSFPHDKYQLQS